MQKQQQHDLQSLLTPFDAASLGEGDINAGANLLAAMAITLANLAKFVPLHIDRDARAPGRDRASIWWAVAPREGGRSPEGAGLSEWPYEPRTGSRFFALYSWVRSTHLPVN